MIKNLNKLLPPIIHINTSTPSNPLCIFYEKNDKLINKFLKKTPFKVYLHTLLRFTVNL